jgi:uncharacterized phage protein (TIGR01671 family)
MTDKSERNIKFRIWSKLHKKWYTNTILIAYDGLPFAHFVKVDNDGKAVEHQVFNAENLDLVVQQSTGLTDKNGQEIYEGDIVEFCISEDGPETATVTFDNAVFWATYPLYEVVDKRFFCKVIGNVFQGVDK